MNSCMSITIDVVWIKLKMTMLDANKKFTVIRKSRLEYRHKLEKVNTEI